MQYIIPEQDFAEIRQKINKINKQYQKLGFDPFELTILSEELKRISHSSSRFSDFRWSELEPKEKFLTIEISSNLPIVKGHSVVANIILLRPGENIVYNFTDQELPKEFSTMDLKCDHCNTNRARKQSFVLKDENGRYKQIGKACMDNYLSSSIVPMLIKALDLQERFQKDMDGEHSGSSCGGYIKIENYLPFVLKSIQLDGWISAEQSRERYIKSTASAAFEDYLESGENIKNEQEFLEYLGENNIQKARKIFEYMKEFSKKDMEEGNEYERNLKQLFKDEYVDQKFIGFIASSVPFVQRRVEKEECQKTLNNEYIGIVGKRQIFENLKVVFINSIDTEFGVSHLHKMRDEMGHEFIWRTGSAYMDTGSVVTLKGTVKEHKEYNGTKQTVLTRCAVIEPEPENTPA